ncbi:hypothetical protein BsWGS_28197 [Bradybaena similaris]
MVIEESVSRSFAHVWNGKRFCHYLQKLTSITFKFETSCHYLFIVNSSSLALRVWGCQNKQLSPPTQLIVDHWNRQAYVILTSLGSAIYIHSRFYLLQPFKKKITLLQVSLGFIFGQQEFG